MVVDVTIYKNIPLSVDIVREVHEHRVAEACSASRVGLPIPACSNNLTSTATRLKTLVARSTMAARLRNPAPLDYV